MRGQGRQHGGKTKAWPSQHGIPLAARASRPSSSRRPPLRWLPMVPPLAGEVACGHRVRGPAGPRPGELAGSPTERPSPGTSTAGIEGRAGSCRPDAGQVGWRRPLSASLSVATRRRPRARLRPLRLGAPCAGGRVSPEGASTASPGPGGCARPGRRDRGEQPSRSANVPRASRAARPTLASRRARLVAARPSFRGRERGQRPEARPGRRGPRRRGHAPEGETRRPWARRAGSRQPAGAVRCSARG
jgi:hypothetical protein